MNISRDEARDALSAIERAGAQVSEVRNYAYASPFLLLWGAIWAVANVIADVRPALAGRAWLVCLVLGFSATTALWCAWRCARRSATIRASTSARWHGA